MKYIKITTASPLYVIFSKVNGYFEETNKNKYLALVTTKESKEIIRKYEELWCKFRDLIRSLTKSSNYFDECYMKIKLNSDDELTLNKSIGIPSIIIVIRAVFHMANIIYKFS